MESSSSSSDRTTHRSNELFICFTSMKTSSLSPGRARDPPISLSTSKHRASGSIKNAQASPMFPTGSKKRGSGFENPSNPEPSSPKVTCIGQVRVKTKKQGEKMRHLSRRRRRSGELVSFRKIEHSAIQRQSSVNSIHHQQECSSHRNQRWVHLPLTICETLRGFGSEFNCLFPCKSSCFSGERVGRESREDLERWLSGESGKRRDVELVVDDEENDDEDGGTQGRVIRRHVFDEIEIKECNEQGGRVSVCVPPKNALLLMRCRSDPVKMEALASKFWEPKLQPAEDEDEDVESEGCNNDENTDRNVEEENVNVVVSFDKVRMVEVFDQDRRASVSYNIINQVEENVDNLKMEMEVLGNEDGKLVKDLHVNEQIGEQKDETSFVTALEALVSEETELAVEEERRVSYSCNSFLVHSDDHEICKPGQKEQESEDASVFDKKESTFEQEERAKDVALVGKANAQVLEDESDQKIKKVEREQTQGLPECLLLMMCEPKLSMEVSKETWVCSTDFIRGRPQKKMPHAPPHQHKKSGAGDEEQPVVMKRNSVDSKCNNNPFAALPPPYPAAQNIQPGRSSCCFPAARGGVSMASMIEQKLGDAVAYEPFVLTRCKSEPMRTASKLAQEVCFRKNKGIEPHRRATFGIGAAGAGC